MITIDYNTYAKHGEMIAMKARIKVVIGYK